MILQGTTNLYISILIKLLRNQSSTASLLILQVRLILLTSGYYFTKVFRGKIAPTLVYSALVMELQNFSEMTPIKHSGGKMTHKLVYSALERSS